MSKIFYDHLIILEEIHLHIKKMTNSLEEKQELWNLIDEIIHHRVLEVILDKLPSKYHEEFLEKLHQTPYDDRHIDYLNEKVEEDIENVIINEISVLENEILKEIVGNGD